MVFFPDKKIIFMCVVVTIISITLNGCSEYGNSVDGSINRGKNNSGDINGDEYADLVVGAIGGYSDSQDFVYVFNGNSKEITDIAESKIRYDKHSSLTIGDVNKDGYADLVVGINSYNEIGRVYVHLGTHEEIGVSDYQSCFLQT